MNKVNKDDEAAIILLIQIQHIYLNICIHLCTYEIVKIGICCIVWRQKKKEKKNRPNILRIPQRITNDNNQQQKSRRKMRTYNIQSTIMLNAIQFIAPHRQPFFFCLSKNQIIFIYMSLQLYSTLFNCKWLPIIIILIIIHHSLTELLID